MPGLNSWGSHQQGPIPKRETPLENLPTGTPDGKPKRGKGVGDRSSGQHDDLSFFPDLDNTVESFASGSKSGTN